MSDLNYFNYFTEIEEHFQKARDTSMFLLSPLDWALIETWKEAGVPLSAVLKGIDRAFEKWHARKKKTRRVNSLAYCAQEVLSAAREDSEDDSGRREAQAPFSHEELAGYFRGNAGKLRRIALGAPEIAAAGYRAAAESLDKLAAEAGQGGLDDLEAVEQRLTVMEQRLLAAAMQHLDEEEMVNARLELQRELAPYRSKMTAEQLARLEEQYLQRKCLEAVGAPRLSLFYFDPAASARNE